MYYNEEVGIDNVKVNSPYLHDVLYCMTYCAF